MITTYTMADDIGESYFINYKDKNNITKEREHKTPTAEKADTDHNTCNSKMATATDGDADGDDAFGSFDDEFGSFDAADATTTAHDMMEPVVPTTANNNSTDEVEGSLLPPVPVDATNHNHVDGPSGDDDNSSYSSQLVTDTPPSIPSAEEAMESADETVTAPMASDPFTSIGGGAADAPLPALSGSADSAEGFGSFGGFGDTPASSDGDADADANNNEVEATSTDVPVPEPEEVETFAATAAGDGDVDLFGAEEADTDAGTNDAEAADAISAAEPPPVAPANPPLDQLSSFVTAATEEEEEDKSETEDAAPSNDDQEEDGDSGIIEDDFGGFEDSASEEEEKKDGSPIATKLSALSDTAESTAPPALPLEAEDVAPADSFGTFDDGIGNTDADDGDTSDQKVDVLETEGSDINGDHDEVAGSTAFGAFGDVPTPVEEPQAEETDTGQSEIETITVGGTNGAAVSEEAVLDAEDQKTAKLADLPVAAPDTVESNDDSNGFDAFAGVSSTNLVVADALTDPKETEMSAEETDSDDGFDAFNEAPVVAEQKETPTKLIDTDPSSNVDVPANDALEATKDSETVFDEDIEDDGFDAFAEAPVVIPVSSSSPEKADHGNELDAPASLPVPAPDEPSDFDGGEPAEQDEDESDDDFGDFDAFAEAPAASFTPEETYQDDVLDAPAPTCTTAPDASKLSEGEMEEEDDEDDDDFGDFGAFDEAPTPEPAADTDPVPHAPPTTSMAEPAPTDEEFAASFEEQAVVALPTAQSTHAGSDPIFQKATVVCKGMFRQYAPSLPEEGQHEEVTESSMPVRSILDSILADESTPVPSSSSLSSKEKIQSFFSETEIERDPAMLIMNYDMPKPYAQYSTDSGADLKTDRGLSLEESSHSNGADAFVPEVLSIDLPKESELSLEERALEGQAEPSAEFVDFPMSATRVEIPAKEEANGGGGFADFGVSHASVTEPPAPAVAEAASSAVDKFLAKIPDLSFMLSKELVLPKK